MKKTDKKSSFKRIIPRILQINRIFTCRSNRQKDPQYHNFKEIKNARLKAECNIAKAYLYVEKKRFNL